MSQVENENGEPVNQDTGATDTSTPDVDMEEMVGKMEAAYEAGYATQVLHSGKTEDDIPDLKEVSQYRYNMVDDTVEILKEQANELVEASSGSEGPSAIAPEAGETVTPESGEAAEGPTAIAPDTE